MWECRITAKKQMRFVIPLRSHKKKLSPIHCFKKSERWKGRNDPCRRRKVISPFRFCPKSDEKAIILAFLSDADGQAQIYRYDSRKVREKLTDVKGGVREFTWSLDGTKIAFLAGNGDTQEREEHLLIPLSLRIMDIVGMKSMGFVDRKKGVFPVMDSFCRR